MILPSNGLINLIAWVSSTKKWVYMRRTNFHKNVVQWQRRTNMYNWVQMCKTMNKCVQECTNTSTESHDSRYIAREPIDLSQSVIALWETNLSVLEGIFQNFTNVWHICNRCWTRICPRLYTTWETDILTNGHCWPLPTCTYLLWPFWSFLYISSSLRTQTLPQLNFWWIEKSDFDDERQAVSDFRLFGIIIGIFDIVIGSFGNFFTILAFTRSEIKLNMTINNNGRADEVLSGRNGEIQVNSPQNGRSSFTLVECVFLIVIWHEFRTEQKRSPNFDLPRTDYLDRPFYSWTSTVLIL